MLCQLPWCTPPVCRNVAIVASPDRELARDFIQRTQEAILCQLKFAFCELVMTDQFFHQGNAYYATLGAPQAADDSDNSNVPERNLKRQRTRKW